ncbi:MAG: hypothetical protein CL489_06090 [Acidobacteria bacterium]|nr:hypothetical protein [Acidobacteriota bacterium]|tara:strand:+ start:8353 stop:9381 length:1029 start_codon:yes stop_codon:yes gene_type:complete
MATTKTLLQGFDGREDFRDMLREMRTAALRSWDITLAIRIRKVLRNNKLFEKVYDHATVTSAQALLDSPRLSEFGDGEFGKWFLDWFKNGGAQAIIEFIRALLPLFGAFMSVLLPLLITLSLCATAQGQSIKGAETAKPGSLVVLTPVDADDVRTVWNLNYPEQFEEYAEENGKLFIAMPSKTISFSLLVIPNDTTLPIRNLRHTVSPSDAPVVPGPGPDPVVPKPPEIDVTQSPIYQFVKNSFESIPDPNKRERAGKLAKSFGIICAQIKNKEITTVNDLLTDIREANLKDWPEDSRQLWTSFRNGMARQFDTLEDAGELETVDDFYLHLKAIQVALEESV